MPDDIVNGSVNETVANAARQKTVDFVIRFLVGSAVLLVTVTLAILAQAILTADNLREFKWTTPSRDTMLYGASWVVLLIISTLAVIQVREVMSECQYSRYRTRANNLGIIIGLVLTIFLFKQPFLDRVFASHTTSEILGMILFGTGATTGWIVWYLRDLKQYGEFFHVLLLTVIIGFCWYARLTAPEEVQLTAVAFLLGSLARLAKDYLDTAAREDMNANPKPPRFKLELQH